MLLLVFANRSASKRQPSPCNHKPCQCDARNATTSKRKRCTQLQMNADIRTDIQRGSTPWDTFLHPHRRRPTTEVLHPHLRRNPKWRFPFTAPWTPQPLPVWRAETSDRLHRRCPKLPGVPPRCPPATQAGQRHRCAVPWYAAVLVRAVLVLRPHGSRSVSLGSHVARNPVPRQRSQDM